MARKLSMANLCGLAAIGAWGDNSPRFGPDIRTSDLIASFGGKVPAARLAGKLPGHDGEETLITFPDGSYGLGTESSYRAVDCTEDEADTFEMLSASLSTSALVSLLEEVKEQFYSSIDGLEKPENLPGANALCFLYGLAAALSFELDERSNPSSQE